MKRIVLISCASKKEDKKMKAKDLYISTLFKYSLAYAHLINPDKILILSALHHVLELEQEIEPYNVTLSNVPKNKRKLEVKFLDSKEKKIWAIKVIELLSRHADLKRDEFIVLASQEYIKPIQNNIIHLEDRLKGLRIGERIKYLKAQLSFN